MKLKSGITKEWLRKIKDQAGNLIERNIWADEWGRWHETTKDGKEIIYPKEQAEVRMHDARDVESIPEELRVCGFWLRLDGLWVAPMAVLGYKNNPITSQVVYAERNDLAAGGRKIYTETLILDAEKGARIHVAHTELDADMRRIEAGCWEKWVDLEKGSGADEKNDPDCH